MIAARKRINEAPAVRFAKIAALWAQRMGLPPGNMWEPAIARYMTKQAAQMDNDANCIAFVIATTARRLGVSVKGI